MCNSFNIACVLHGITFWHGVVKFVDVGQRSTSRAQIFIGTFHRFLRALYDLPMKKLRNMTGRNTTWAVFKANAVSLSRKITSMNPVREPFSERVPIHAIFLKKEIPIE